jgi:hypothetical protein
MIKKIIFFILIFSSLVTPMKIFAKIGVGIGTGEIKYEEKLKPGTIYSLPGINVVNTGDEASEYEINLAFKNNAEELQPEKEWFSFSPDSFYLEPKESKLVEIRLELPVKVEPGDYFSYIEAKPVKKSIQESGAKVGVASAAKLYFTIMPANFLTGLLYKVASYWTHYAPWTYIAAIVILLATIFVIIKRFVSFDFKFKKKDNIVTDDYSSGAQEKDLDDVIFLILSEVENYSSRLSSDKFEAVFREAKKNKKGVVDFFYNHQSYVLSDVSLELRDILVLTQDGLEKVKFKGRDTYEAILKKVVSGIIG